MRYVYGRPGSSRDSGRDRRAVAHGTCRRYVGGRSRPVAAAAREEDKRSVLEARCVAVRSVSAMIRLRICRVQPIRHDVAVTSSPSPLATARDAFLRGDFVACLHALDEAAQLQPAERREATLLRAAPPVRSEEHT